MKKVSRILAIILSLVITSSLLSSCAAAKPSKQTAAEKNIPNFNATGFPIVKEPITLKFMVSKTASQEDYANTMIWSEYEKKTNIHIDWDAVLSNNIAEKRNLVLASGQNLPDAFYRAGFGRNDPMKYGKEGLFIPLNNLIDKYAPNLKKVLNDYDAVRKSLPAPDGTIYALPAVTDCYENEMNQKLFINTKWLEKVGKKMPTTLDELYDVLKAFKTQDPNGNGKQDEIPFTATNTTQIFNVLKGSYGMMNKGLTHSKVDVDPATGKLRFLPITNEFREMLSFLNKLYKEGLMDEEIFTMTSAKITAKASLNVLGSTADIITTQLGNYGGDFAGIPKPLKGPYKDLMYTAIRSHISTQCAVTITSTNKYPEATMRWLDYFYSEEGGRMYFMGIEGKSYHKTADGKYEFLPDILSQVGNGKTFDQVVAKYVPYMGGGNPALMKGEYFYGSEMLPGQKEAADYMMPYVPKDLWGYFSYTPEENERIDSLEADMFKGHYDVMIPKFISGEVNVNDDAEWQKFVDAFYQMGLDEYMKIYQTARERYEKA
ncbi:MAG: extracellular solute-binding protein [Bacillota bacterium]|nr:extracellular solute-binding protein [Bacillota bacterium]